MQMVAKLYAIDANCYILYKTIWYDFKNDFITLCNDANGYKTLCDGCTGLENITERLQMVSEHYAMLQMVAKHSALIAISFWNFIIGI